MVLQRIGNLFNSAFPELIWSLSPFFLSLISVGTSILSYKLWEIVLDASAVALGSLTWYQPPLGAPRLEQGTPLENPGAWLPHPTPPHREQFFLGASPPHFL